MRKDNAAGVIACSNHVYVGNWKYYNSPNQTVINVQAKQAIESFIFDNQGLSLIDTVTWPNNVILTAVESMYSKNASSISSVKETTTLP